MSNIKQQGMEAIGFQPELRAERLNEDALYAAIGRVNLRVIEGTVDGKNETYTQMMANNPHTLESKVQEEAEEVATASRYESLERVLYESADLLDQLDIILELKGLSLIDALNEWSRRGVSDE